MLTEPNRKQSAEDVLMKRHYANMHQIYRIAPMLDTNITYEVVDEQ